MFLIKKMKLNFLYFLLCISLTLLFVSCSKDRLEKMGVAKKKNNQFVVSRKAPLEMPPDMFLRPPELKNKKINNISNLEDDELSIDDILNNEVNVKEKPDNAIKRKKSKEKRILKKILNTKAIVLN